MIDLVADRVIAANPRARALLVLQDTLGSSFSHLIGANLPRFIVLVDEIAHRGEAWSRDLTLATTTGAPLRVEIRGRLVAHAPSLLVLTLLDLDEMDRHARIAQAAELHRSGLLEWQREQEFFSDSNARTS